MLGRFRRPRPPHGRARGHAARKPCPADFGVAGLNLNFARMSAPRSTYSSNEGPSLHTIAAMTGAATNSVGGAWVALLLIATFGAVLVMLLQRQRRLRDELRETRLAAQGLAD